MARYVLGKTVFDNRVDVVFSAETVKSVGKNFYMGDFLNFLFYDGS